MSHNSMSSMASAFLLLACYELIKHNQFPVCFTLQNWLPQKMTQMSCVLPEATGNMSMYWLWGKLISFHLLLDHEEMQRSGLKWSLMVVLYSLQLWRRGARQIKYWLVTINPNSDITCGQIHYRNRLRNIAYFSTSSCAASGPKSKLMINQVN